jgi:hypothetical protein
METPTEALSGDLAGAVRREFERSPQLALTLAQARRLWALDDRTCTTVLCALIEGGVLQQRGTRFVLATGRAPAVDQPEP